MAAAVATIAEPRPRVREPKGLPIEAGGHTFYLASLGLASGFARERSDLFDEVTASGQIDRMTIFTLALCMLAANYDMTSEELGAVILATDRQQLVNAVINNTIFEELPPERQTYHYWARTGIIAAGLDPAKIHEDDIPGVIFHLVRTRRMASSKEGTIAGRHEDLRADLIGMM